MANYILDFYCHEAKFVVEADGGQHSDRQQAARDAKRTAYLNSLGIRVVRFWDNDVLKHSDAVAEKIYRELMAEGNHQKGQDPHPGALPVGEGEDPHPSPLPEGEGEELFPDAFLREEAVSDGRDRS